ncbi:MAG: hypothetical protein WD993_06590 [Thermoleophilaceae bacterium]
MDLRRLRIGEWTAAAAGVALIASLWLPWWTSPSGSFERSTGAGGLSRESVDWTAWEALAVVDALLLALGVLALATWAIAAVARAAGPGVIAAALLTPFALAMAVVCLVRVLNAPGDLAPPGAEVGTAYGAWVGLAATLGVLAGTLVAMRDERLGEPGRPTDQTGVPVAEQAPVERLPGPPAA